MEKFNHGDEVLLGYRQPRSFEKTENTRYSDSDTDFNDVFGGPPKRYSMQEMRMRYSFNGDSEDDNTVFSTRGDSRYEKPVFGEESVNRRRFNVNNDFFGDIFKGDDSFSSPMRTDREPFGSTPGSRVLSPNHPLPPPEAEIFDTSLPAQFSLPAILTTTMDSPFIGSSNSNSEINKDGNSNEISDSQTSRSSYSKFLNRSTGGKNEARGDRQFYRQSPLSREVFLANDEPPDAIKSDGKDKGSKLKEDSENMESPVDENLFHFSIYKWAGAGVPLMASLRVGKKSKLEEKSKTERFLSSNGSIKSNGLDNERSEYDKNESVSRNAGPKSIEDKREQNNKESNQQETDSHIKDATREVLESKIPDGTENPDVLGNAIFNLLSDQVGIHEILVKEVLANVAEPEMKPLLSENVDAKGNSNEENGRAARKVPISNKEKKNDTKRKTSKKESVKKDSLPGSPVKNTPGVKGRVTEFVKIFNQDSTKKTKIHGDTRSQSSRWKSNDKYGTDSEESNILKMNVEVDSSIVDNAPKAFGKVDETPKKDTVEESSNHTSSRITDQKNASSFHASSHETSKATSENSEDHFHESFSVEEISQDQEKVSQTSGDPEEIRASDAKIQQWSNGRKGNIRSLLSTLQLVLWPESGWKPVPLVNIIEGSSVKRSYQRALLCLHPDKLQQKDASFIQKYTAEKVFDILQEAWDHFNSLGAI